MKVCILTSSRAEYGLLYPTLKAVDESDALDLKLVVTGTHLSHEFGYTLNDILSDGFQPSITIPNLVSDDSSLAITFSSSILMQSLATFFEQTEPHCFIVLGDRLELLAACEAAMIAKIPIVHIHGGEITEGAIDDKVRHAISKLANLHFTSTEAYRQRIIQMGEQEETVIKCGALGLESIDKKNILSTNELSEIFSFDLNGNYFLIVYHPETNKDSSDISDLFKLMDDYQDYKMVIIYPNSDNMSREIISQIENYKNNFPNNVLLIKSAVRTNYIGLMNHCSIFIGNSSSGIIEMPSFYRPIINIGDRQKGRIKSKSTIDSNLDYKSLKLAVEVAFSDDFQNELATMHNPYEGIKPSALIVEKLEEKIPTMTVQKKFMDLNFNS